MLRFAPHSTFASIFFVWFALWFVAGQYVSIDFYRLIFGDVVQRGLTLTALLVALVLIFVPIMRRFRDQMRWSYALLCAGLLVTVEIFWRFTMNSAAYDFAKVVALVLHLSTPALIAFGIIAVVGERRRRIPEATATIVS